MQVLAKNSEHGVFSTGFMLPKGTRLPGLSPDAQLHHRGSRIMFAGSLPCFVLPSPAGTHLSCQQGAAHPRRAQLCSAGLAAVIVHTGATGAGGSDPLLIGTQAFGWESIWLHVPQKCDSETTV